MTYSDEASFWALHLPRMQGVGYMPPNEPEPESEQPEPDVAEMSIEEFAQYRAEHGIDSSDIFGVHPWRRPTPTNKE